MTGRAVLAKLVRAVYNVTDSYGSSRDRKKVKEFLAKPGSCDFQTYLYVGRIPLANFYAHADLAFDKGSLWQEVESVFQKKTINQPASLSAETELIDLALWIEAELS